jgi:hypothetical protein
MDHTTFAVLAQAATTAAPFAVIGGVWLWERRRGTLPVAPLTFALSVFAGAAIFGCGLFCLVWWDKPLAPRIIEPDLAIPCWIYCGLTLADSWAWVTMASGALLGLAGLLMTRAGTARAGVWLGIALGVWTFPLGVLAAYAGWRTRSQYAKREA